MQGDNPAKKYAAARKVVGAAPEVLGAAASAAVVLKTGSGAEGILAGALTIPGVKLAAQDVLERHLSRRERYRIGEVLTYAQAAYQERISDGIALRTDGWFDERPKRRSPVAEICEGVLLKAQKEHQERKVEYYGYLLANLGFVTNIDANLANWLMELSGQLTWTQLVMISMVGRKEDLSLPDITIGENNGEWNPWGLHQQLADLGYARRQLIAAPREPTPKPSGPRNFSIPKPVSFRLVEMELCHEGFLMNTLMWLDRIPATDVEELIHGLGAAA